MSDELLAEIRQLREDLADSERRLRESRDQIADYQRTTKRLHKEKEELPQQILEREQASVANSNAKIAQLQGRIESIKQRHGRHWARVTGVATEIVSIERQIKDEQKRMDKLLPASEFGSLSEVKNTVDKTMYKHWSSRLVRLQQDVDVNGASPHVAAELKTAADEVDAIARKISEREGIRLPGSRDL